MSFIPTGCTFILSLFICQTLVYAQAPTDEQSRWEAQASRVSITRDKWDVPHISGQTDADAVFGLIYAQCEDDFDRIERNYIGVLGRSAEVFGEGYLYEDLRQQLFTDTLAAQAQMNIAPPWLRLLLQAWADGMNFYLMKHPEVKPRLITRFEPWMPLIFSEGSIGGDISMVPLERLKDCYGKSKPAPAKPLKPGTQPAKGAKGSNGIAIAPRKSASGNAMLLINPHTTFYFRTEVHVQSQQGLNAYGAVTWGQFFVYQGFNENCGWMHTSSSTDVLDEYLVQFIGPDKTQYRFGDTLKPVGKRTIQLKYLQNGKLLKKEFKTFFTHHGPVTGKTDTNWIATRIMNKPLEALQQSFLRTKSTDFAGFEETMQLRTNSSNNTVFADKSGNIAYWQGNFVPKRKFAGSTRGLLDGSNPDNDWQGEHELTEIIQYKNPSSGFIQNCNSSAYWATGEYLQSSQYPDYMGADQQNYRAVNAIRHLKNDSTLSLEQFIALVYNPQMPAFEILMPSLLEAIKLVAVTESADHQRLREAYSLFEPWNATWSVESFATTLAICWGEKLLRYASQNPPSEGYQDDIAFVKYMAGGIKETVLTNCLLEAMKELENDFKTWRVPWGEYNRFQRVSGKYDEAFSDAKPSLPVPFAQGFWGSLATSDARKYPGTIRQYGSSGNAFVAVVEFGSRLKAYTVVPGGHSSDPSSVHFSDQAELFCGLRLKKVLYYPDEMEREVERIYHPGE